MKELVSTEKKLVLHCNYIHVVNLPHFKWIELMTKGYLLKCQLFNLFTVGEFIYQFSL